MFNSAVKILNTSGCQFVFLQPPVCVTEIRIYKIFIITKSKRIDNLIFKLLQVFHSQVVLFNLRISNCFVIMNIKLPQDCTRIVFIKYQFRFIQFIQLLKIITYRHKGNCLQKSPLDPSEFVIDMTIMEILNSIIHQLNGIISRRSSIDFV
ncbi:hypothetical protein ES705_40869 [subsurface metagenome]